MNTQTCKNCEHFNQYYVKRSTKFAPIDCGHCKLSIKHIKNPHRFVCAHFVLLDKPSKMDVRNQSIQQLLASIAKNSANVLAVLTTD